MKKKFINGLLLVALFVGFTGSMVSCKDYDDEKFGNLEGVLKDTEASLRQALNAQQQTLQSLQAQIDALTKQLNDCCESFKKELNEKLQNYVDWSTYNSFTTEINGKLLTFYTKEEVNKNFYTKDEVDALFTNYYDKATIDAKLEALRNEIQELTKKEAVAQTIADLLNESNTTLQDALYKYFTNSPAILEFIKNNSGIDNAAVKKLIEEALVSVNLEITNAAALADKALKLAQANEAKIADMENTIANLDETVKTLESSIISLGEELDNVSKIANEAKAEAETNSLLIANLQASFDAMLETLNALQSDANVMGAQLDNLEMAVDALKVMVNDVEKEIEDLAAVVAETVAQANDFHNQMLETISGLVSSISTNAQTIGQLQSDFEAYQVEMDDVISSLYDAIVYVYTMAYYQGQDIEKLADIFDNVMAKFITGIEVNGTHNPLYGEFALPFDVRSNVLVAFHGQLNDYGIQFPTNRPAYYALPEAEQWKNFTDEDMAMLGDLSGITIRKGANREIVAMDGAEGNAGTLYLTVNPTNRDFTGTEFELINSRNETSPVILSDLKKSDHTLYFGYTRAGVTEQSPNGFYEAKATFKLEDLEKGNRLEFDFASVKDVAKDLMNYQDGVDITKLASTIYNNLSKVLEANAVKATWEDELGTRSIVSQYSIAATAVKPLSFAFAKDLSVNEVPGMGYIEDFLDRVIDKIDLELPTFDRRVPIKSLLVEKVDNNRLKFTAVTDSDTYDITVNVSDMFGDLASKVEQGNDIFDVIMDYVVDVNEYLDEMNNIIADGYHDILKHNLSYFIDVINNRFARYMNPNKLLQPIMLIKANGSYARLSESHNYPAYVKGTDLLLAPTTYNAEIISPAYKKFIAVTNVSKDGVSAKGGDATCKSILDQANAQNRIKEVIDGGFSDFIPFKAVNGYTYEILYTAVDYAGLVVAKKFYVKVYE